MGYASTQALDEDSIALLVKGARENAHLIECEDEQLLFAGAEEYADVQNYCPDIDEVSVAEKIALCKSLEAMAVGMDARLRREAEASVFSESGAVEIVNTLGLRVSHRSNIVGGYVQPVAEENGRVSSGSSLFFENDPAKIDAEKTAAEAVKEAVGRPCRRQRALGQLSRAFEKRRIREDAAHVLRRVLRRPRPEGAFAAQGARGREDRRQMPDHRGRSHLPGQAASTPFDGEGVPTLRKEVVSGGVLKTLLHNLKTAKKQGVKTTANACRGGYASPVGVAPSNFCVQPSSLAFEDLLDLLCDGLLITDLQGLARRRGRGERRLFPTRARLSRGERQNRRLREPDHAGGQLLSLLQGVEAVGGDLKFSAPGASAFASPRCCCRRFRWRENNRLP